MKNLARKRISDEMIAVMVVILLVVSIITIFPIIRISGFQTTEYDYAQANLTVESEIGCDFLDAFINLGTGIQGESNTSEQVEDYWLLQNTGTENVTVNISVYGAPGGWLFQSDTACGGDCKAETQYWQYICNQSQTLSGTCNINSYTDVRDTMTDEIALTGLEPSGEHDNATFGVNATVPDGELAGEKYGDVEARCVIIPSA